MRKIIPRLLGLGVLVLVGCEAESPPGGPGVGEAGNGAAANGVEPGVVDEEQTFELEVPAIATRIEQGAQGDVQIEVDREDAFNQAVTLTFESPEGISVSPEEVAVPAGSEEVNVRVAVDGAATAGEHTIKVTGTPETGAATSVNLTVQVTQADAGDNVPETTLP